MRSKAFAPANIPLSRASPLRPCSWLPRPSNLRPNILRVFRRGRGVGLRRAALLQRHVASRPREYGAYGRAATAGGVIFEHIGVRVRRGNRHSVVVRDVERFPIRANQIERRYAAVEVLNKDWIWYLVVLCSVLIGVSATYLVNARLAKKYPIVAPQPKTVKMAVFGMDYEDLRIRFLRLLFNLGLRRIAAVGRVHIERVARPT